MKKIFIVNPTAGDGKALNILRELQNLLHDSNEDYDIYYTTGPKDATDIAKSFNNPNEQYIIYSVGGDGTLFEVVNGIGNSNNILGIIPTGTGNDFIKSIDSNNDITYVDLCRMNEYYFINIASVGIDADIANNQSTMKKIGIPKVLSYKASILYTYFSFKNPSVNIEINDKEISQDVTLLTICNGKYYGGGFKIAPNAIYNDGLFDIYLADKVNKLKIPGLILKLVKGTHEDSKYVHKLSGNKLTIHSDKLLNCNLDGEIFKLHDMEFEVTDKKIPIYTAYDKIKKLCKSKGLYK